MDRRFAIKQLGLSSIGAMLSPALLSAMESCTSAPVNDYPRLKLSYEQDLLLQELVEIIIPTTDTPGAKVAGVNRYIDRVLDKVRNEEEAALFLSSLQEMLDTDWLDLNEEERKQSLQQMEASSKQAKGPSFFNMLKAMTVYGYYTSKIGATQELEYVHAAGTYRGDVPYTEIGKNYS